MANPLHVLLVTSWGQPQCGIQAHSEQLIDYVKQADPDIVITPSADSLDPVECGKQPPPVDVIHLNWHRALHSRWSPAWIRQYQQLGVKFVVTWHDTMGHESPDQLSKEVHDVADAFIVHEPVIGLEQAIYWRQAVPEMNGYQADRTGIYGRPFVGSVGFDFGWKNYDRLCEIAYAVGWGVALCVPEMSKDREADLRQRNPWLVVRRNEGLQEVLALLHVCQATAFLYVNGNSGTSAAIRIGIGARKPVIAMAGQRQFRDLHDEMAIRWATSMEHAQDLLVGLRCGDWDGRTVELANRDSWRHAGRKHAELYRSLV
jgi:hypothetical protein